MTRLAAPGVESPVASPQSEALTDQRRNLIFLAVVLGMLVAALDQTITAAALPAVAAFLCT